MGISYILLASLHFLKELPDSAKSHWNHRRTHSNQYYRTQVVFNKRYLSKEKTCYYQAHYPSQSTCDIKKLKFGKGHFRYSGNERCKGTYNWNEARQNDSLAAMIFIKHMGLLQCRLIQSFVIVRKHLMSDCTSNPVVNRIPENRSHH